MASHLLVVDDDQPTAEFLAATLEAAGYAVTWVTTAEDAIERLRQENFDTLLTDLGMPHVDGLAVAASIAAAVPATSIIMLTGWGQRLVATGEVPPHVVAVLSKPPNLSELRHTLAECIGERDGG